MSKKLEQSAEYSPIFNRIIELCDCQKITVSNLLDMFSSSRSAINAWKKGNIDAETIYNIAETLNVSMEYLIKGKEISKLDLNTYEKELTENEQELLEIFNKFNEREQIKIIGKIEDWFETKQKRENEIKIADSENQSVSNQPTQSKWRITARRTDGVYESRLATPEEIEKLEQLKDAPEPEY